MGLIQAVAGSLVGTIQETWKDYFVCDALDNDTLMVKGVKKGGSSEIITNGSGIVVNEGQCALVVEEGNIVEVAAEPGSYTFDTSISPSVFDGGLQGIKDTFKDMLERFTYGGEVNKSQRVYYVNTKEILKNMYGTATPIPFRVVDKNIGLDLDIAVRCNGEYTFKIVNPLVFFKSIAGNTHDRFDKEELASTMKAEMLSALNPAFAKISSLGIRYSELPSHTEELTQAIAEALNEKWTENRGIAFVNIAINSVSIPEEYADKISNAQMAAINKDPNMANATILNATADALRDAANNPAGAGVGFMNINMATNAGASMIQPTGNAGATTGGDYGFCPFCGKPLAVQGAKFCAYCGKEIK